LNPIYSNNSLFRNEFLLQRGRKGRIVSWMWRKFVEEKSLTISIGGICDEHSSIQPDFIYDTREL
jgi:hypothetical protein